MTEYAAGRVGEGDSQYWARGRRELTVLFRGEETQIMDVAGMLRPVKPACLTLKMDRKAEQGARLTDKEGPLRIRYSSIPNIRHCEACADFRPHQVPV